MSAPKIHAYNINVLTLNNAINLAKRSRQSWHDTGSKIKVKSAMILNGILMKQKVMEIINIIYVEQYVPGIVLRHS